MLSGIVTSSLQSYTSVEEDVTQLVVMITRKTKINSIIDYLLRKHNSSIKITSTPQKNNNFIIGNNKLAKNILNWKLSKNIFIAADEIYNK